MLGLNSIRWLIAIKRVRSSLLKLAITDDLIVGIAIAIEYMLVDALLSAEPHMNYAKKIFEPEQYLHLTDAIMPFIEANPAPVTNPSLRFFSMFDFYCLP
jgi:hypothetical protein